MESTFPPKPRGWLKLFVGGQIYRYQKCLAGGLSRWKCDIDERDFRCAGFALTRRRGPRCVVVNLGPHGANCEPGESRKDTPAIRHAVIQTAGGASGVTPTRGVGGNLAGDGEGATHTLPDPHKLKRSAQNAPYRAQKRAKADDEGGVVENYRSLEVLAIPAKLLRRGGDDFILYDLGPGADRILLFGADPNMRALRSSPVWGADGAFKVCPNLRAQVYTIHPVSSGYCMPCISALMPNKSQGAYATIWGQARDLAGDDADRERFLAVDF